MSSTTTTCPSCCVKILRQVPVLGLAFTPVPPSWDDLEKTLQIYALITGLVLSMVGGVIFEDVGDLDKATDIYGALYVSLELLFLAVMVVACLYIYLMVYVDQEILQDEESLEEDKQAEKERIRRWWNSGGSALFIALPICLFVASWQFLMGVTFVFESRLRKRGGEFHYGFLMSWRTLPIAAFVMFVIIHLSFLKAGWSRSRHCGMEPPPRDGAATAMVSRRAKEWLDQ